MREYFWIKEHSRGNVISAAQYQGLENSVVMARNNSVPSAPNHDCGYYPTKAYILVEFSSSANFVQDRDQFVSEMCGGMSEELCALLQEAQYHVCQGGSSVAISAHARMLNQTLIHYRTRPALPEQEDGDYTCVSPALLLSNGRPIYSQPCATSCGAVFYHPFSWNYYLRVKPKEALSVHADRAWIGLSAGHKSGNIAWRVTTGLCGYGFVDFARFNGGRCHGYPQQYSGRQESRLDGSQYGIPVYLGSNYKTEVLIGRCAFVVHLPEDCSCSCDYSQCSCYRCDCGCSCSCTCSCTCHICYTEPRVIPIRTGDEMWATVFVSWMEDPFAQQRYWPYRDVQFSDGSIRFFDARTIVYHYGSIGVHDPYPHNFAREVCGKLDAADFGTMTQWAQGKMDGWLYNQLLAQSGREVGIYGSPEAEFCGKPVGAVVRMAATDLNRPIRSEVFPFAGSCGDKIVIGAYYEREDDIKTLGYLSQCNAAAGAGYPPRQAVTIYSRDDINAELYFDEFSATAWDAVARVRFGLSTNYDWEDYSSAELWGALVGCMNESLAVYYDAVGDINYTIEEVGVTGTVSAAAGVAYFTLYDLCVMCGITPTPATVGECFELLTAGLTLAFAFNEWRTDTPPWANVRSIGIAPTFNAKPCTSL